MSILDYAVARKLGIAFGGGSSFLTPKVIAQKLGGGGSTVLPDKYTWEALFASMDAGTYATDYAIGDCIPLDLGSEGLINMQIAAFDADDLADGSGKAKITWIAKELLATSKPMGYGNWENCSMRSYLKNTIKPLIPDTVKNRICEISKLRNDYSSGSWAQSTFVDDVWLPYRNDIYPPNGMYTLLYYTYETAIKTKVGETEPIEWWTSMQQSSLNWAFILPTGSQNLRMAEYGTELGVCLGFCTN